MGNWISGTYIKFNHTINWRFTSWLASLIIVFGLWILPVETVKAQLEFGVVWDLPDEETLLLPQLRGLQNLGFNHVYIPPTTTPGQMQRIEQSRLQVHVAPLFRFVITEEFRKNPQYFFDSLATHILAFERYSRVQAIGLFAYSPVFDKSLRHSLASKIYDLRGQTDKNVFNVITSAIQPEYTLSGVSHYLTIDEFNDRDTVRLHQNNQPVLYQPENYHIFKKHEFRRLLQYLAQSNRSRTLFVTSEWLAARLANEEPIGEIISIFSQSDDATFAIQQTESHSNPLSIPVILLLLLFGSMGVHFYNNPTYRHSLFRYFNTHTFFVNDVMAWRIRTMAPGIVLLIQHALAGGLILFILQHIFLNSVGWQALIHYYPLFYYAYTSLPLIALYGMLGILFIEFVTVLWFYITSKTARHLNQIVLLYAWPMHIGILLSGLTVLLAINNASGFIILLLAGLFIVSWGLGTITAIFDIGSVNHRLSAPYMLINTGTLVLLLAAVVYLTFKINLPEVLYLAFQLS